jgi:dTDP-4-dehydrorhamnose 3,5-epimerase
MKITPSSIPEVLLIEPDVFGDSRGFFMESWHKEKYAEHGLDVDFVQDNHSRSSKNVLRGLHFQLDKPQGKLMRVVSGSVFDVAVDIRVGSPTFGQWIGVELSGENNKQLYIPPGFAHGFCVTSESVDFLYKCTEYYSPQSEHGILWSDPEIGIEWPGENFLISDKDSKCNCLKDMMDSLPVYENRL